MSILTDKVQALVESISRLDGAHQALAAVHAEAKQLHADIGELINSVVGGEPVSAATPDVPPEAPSEYPN